MGIQTLDELLIIRQLHSKMKFALGFVCIAVLALACQAATKRKTVYNHSISSGFSVYQGSGKNDGKTVYNSQISSGFSVWTGSAGRNGTDTKTKYNSNPSWSYAGWSSEWAGSWWRHFSGSWADQYSWSKVQLGKRDATG